MMDSRSGMLIVAIICSLAMALSGCSSGGGGNPAPASTVQLSGTISNTSYTYAKAYTSFYAKIFEFLGYPTNAYAAIAAPTVDMVIAIPMLRGDLRAEEMINSKQATIASDGTFSLALGKDNDWLLVLINSSGTTTTRFVGSLALNTGTDGLLSVPATVAAASALDLGTINSTLSGDALSSGTVTAADFSMTSAQLAAMAKADDIFKNAKNIINNYNPTNGVWYQLRPDFTWYGDYSTVKNVFSGPSLTYHHYSFQLDTNSTSVVISQVCGTNSVPKKTLALYPPSPVTQVSNPTLYDDTHPLTNDQATCSTYDPGTGSLATEATEMNVMGGDFYATDAYGSISYSFSVWFDGPILTGNWKWVEGTTEVGSFDAAVSKPLNGNGTATGYVPSMKLTVDGSNNITAVDVEWYYYDDVLGTYAKVDTADLSVLGHFMDGYEIIMETGSGVTPRRHDSTRLDPVTQTHLAIPIGTNGWKYADSDPGTSFGANDAASVGVFYSSGGIGRFFFFFAPYN